MEVVKNSKKGFVRPKYLIWYRGIDTRTHTQLNITITFNGWSVIKNENLKVFWLS